MMLYLFREITLIHQVALPIAMKSLPTFLIGLFCKYRFHPWSLALSSGLCIIGSFFVQAFYSKTRFHPAALVLLINVALLIIFESVRLLLRGQFSINKMKAIVKGLFSASESDDDITEEEIVLDDHPKWDR